MSGYRGIKPVLTFESDIHPYVAGSSIGSSGMKGWKLQPSPAKR